LQRIYFRFNKTTLILTLVISTPLTYRSSWNFKIITRMNYFFTHDHPLPNLPPSGEGAILSPLGEIRKGVKRTKVIGADSSYPMKE
jgi:hypothetical protein